MASKLVWAALCAAALAFSLPAASRSAGAACSRLKETSLHWDGVFGHVSSMAEAINLKEQIAHFQFKNLIYEKDYCDDIEVSVPGVDTPAQRRAFVVEARPAGFEVSFEPPQILRRSRRGYVKAVFGSRPTLSRANALQRRMASKGYFEGSDIIRLGLHAWKVVIWNVPTKVTAQFKAEARRAGFAVTFERKQL